MIGKDDVDGLDFEPAVGSFQEIVKLRRGANPLGGDNVPAALEVLLGQGETEAAGGTDEKEVFVRYLQG